MIPDDGFVDVSTAARMMGYTEAQIRWLVQRRALRSCAVLDETWVEPAIINLAPPH